MYQINKNENRISKLSKKSFAELKFKERDHLQEWLAYTPEALGEDLLIIQKEFDGFDDTRERLDLLALDKDGQLVIIENKLDDSGRDVVWQALKYTSYCSNLNKSQIVEIYQRYLDQNNKDKNAKQLICDFLDGQEYEEIVLNSGFDQRIMLVAANFRKEVTTTALWLLGHRIKIQCFKVSPYSYKDELFLDINQIIPMAEAEEYMVGMSSKDNEEQQAKGATKRRHLLRREYWERALEALKDNGVSRYQNISPSKDSWLSAGSGVRGCPYNMIFAKNEIRVELSIAQTNADDNKNIYDLLYADKKTIHKKFGTELSWVKLDNLKSCRISYSKGFDGYNKDNWEAMIAWHVEYIAKIENAFSEALTKSGQIIKSKVSTI